MTGQNLRDVFIGMALAVALIQMWFSTFDATRINELKARVTELEERMISNEDQ
jgi:hypothetical protein